MYVKRESERESPEDTTTLWPRRAEITLLSCHISADFESITFSLHRFQRSRCSDSCPTHLLGFCLIFNCADRCSYPFELDPWFYKLLSNFVRCWLRKKSSLAEMTEVSNASQPRCNASTMRHVHVLLVVSVQFVKLSDDAMKTNSKTHTQKIKSNRPAEKFSAFLSFGAFVERALVFRNIFFVFLWSQFSKIS